MMKQKMRNALTAVLLLAVSVTFALPVTRDVCSLYVDKFPIMDRISETLGNCVDIAQGYMGKITDIEIAKIDIENIADIEIPTEDYQQSAEITDTMHEESNLGNHTEITANNNVGTEEIRADEIEVEEHTADEQSEEPVTIEPTFTQAPEGYFEDALFIGDSRTVGLYEYGGIEGADFFASNGMSVYRVSSEKVKVDGIGETKLFDLLNTKKYGKIYVMFGVNELGYDMDYSIEKYQALIEDIQKVQPEAVLYLEASLHVSKVMSETNEIHTNPKINQFNEAIEKMADGKNRFFLDINPVFDDEEGNLAEEYTFDQTHLLGKHYIVWADWLRENTVVR